MAREIYKMNLKKFKKFIKLREKNIVKEEEIPIETIIKENKEK